MSLEQVLERAAHARPGYDLVTFKEAGLPAFVLKLRVLVMERKAISPIEEAVLKSVQAGLDSPESIFEFLGLPRMVLTPVLVSLNTGELINYSRSAGRGTASISLSAKGRHALLEASTLKPQERLVTVCVDALTKKLLFVSPSQLLRGRDMREFGIFEVPTGSAKRPEIEDVPLQDFDRILRRQSAPAEAGDALLSIRRIERRELQFMSCTMLFYKSQLDPNDIQVSFWREDGQSVAHDNAFHEVGGADLVGAQLLASTIDIPSEVVEPSQDVPEVRKPELGSAQNGALRGGKGTGADVGTEVGASVSETMQTILSHEHPGYLRKALTTARKRLVIVAPWIRDAVVDQTFVANLEALLRNGVDVYIGYGIAKSDGGEKKNPAAGKPDINPRAEKELSALAAKYKTFRFVHIGNTHRKSLVCDDRFAVVTSFNWLSYKGSSREKPRDERGIVVRKKHHVERLASEELHLITKGYSGPEICVGRTQGR